MGEDTRAIEGQIEETREHMGDTVSAIAYKADVPGRMKDSAVEKKDALTSHLAGAKNAITGKTSDAMDSAGDGAMRTVGMAQENPLGLAIGAARLALWLGRCFRRHASSRRNSVRWRPRPARLASEAVEHGKQVAEDSIHAAAETASQSGQEHIEQLRDSAKDVVSDR